jgi:hypothetical protein
LPDLSRYRISGSSWRTGLRGNIDQTPRLARPVVTRAAEEKTEPDHRRPNLPLFAPACFR